MCTMYGYIVCSSAAGKGQTKKMNFKGGKERERERHRHTHTMQIPDPLYEMKLHVDENMAREEKGKKE
jgi:hypothetical protein